MWTRTHSSPDVIYSFVIYDIYPLVFHRTPCFIGAAQFHISRQLFDSLSITIVISLPTLIESSLCRLC